MSILIKSEKKYYEIPNDVLEKCEISKEQFENGLKEISADVAGQSAEDLHNVVDLTTCKMDLASIWASCQ